MLRSGDLRGEAHAAAGWNPNVHSQLLTHEVSQPPAPARPSELRQSLSWKALERALSGAGGNARRAAHQRRRGAAGLPGTAGSAGGFAMNAPPLRMTPVAARLARSLDKLCADEAPARPEKTRRKSSPAHGGPASSGADDAPPERDAANELRELLSQHVSRVVNLLREWDEDGSGMATRVEFRRVVPLLGLDVPRKDVDALFDVWDPDGTGRFDYRELYSLLRRRADL